MACVVVVEDDPLVAKYLKYVLEQQGRYEVRVTESGDETLDLAKDPGTAALIVDVSLRNTQLAGRYVDGIELSRAIKAAAEANRVIVILATAHTMAGDRGRLLRDSSADAFVRKPFVDSREVLDVVMRLLEWQARDQKRPTSPE